MTVMKKDKGFLIFDLIIISMMAALGIATKPLITPLVHIITGSLFIPGGAVAGGFYMIWLILGASIVKKKWTATVIAFLQAILAIIMGTAGNFGVLSLILYILPGMVVDIVFFLSKTNNYNLINILLAGIGSNLCGTYLANLILFKLPTIPLIISLSMALLSGGLGGFVAYNIIQQLRKLNMFDYTNEYTKGDV